MVEGNYFFLLFQEGGINFPLSPTGERDGVRGKYLIEKR
jgi:hypothetical protein